MESAGCFTDAHGKCPGCDCHCHCGNPIPDGLVRRLPVWTCPGCGVTVHEPECICRECR
jgi:hypothetical protein